MSEKYYIRSPQGLVTPTWLDSNLKEYLDRGYTRVFPYVDIKRLNINDPTYFTKEEAKQTKLIPLEQVLGQIEAEENLKRAAARAQIDKWTSWDKKLHALGLGALKSASLGTSGYLLKKSAGIAGKPADLLIDFWDFMYDRRFHEGSYAEEFEDETAQYMTNVEKFNTYTFAVGEIGGMVAPSPLRLLGPISKLASKTKYGAKTQQTLSKLLESKKLEKLSKVASKVPGGVSKVAESTITGAAYGVIDPVYSAGLDEDVKFLSDKLLLSSGVGSLIGLGSGIGIGKLKKVGKSTNKLVKKATAVDPSVLKGMKIKGYNPNMLLNAGVKLTEGVSSALVKIGPKYAARSAGKILNPFLDPRNATIWQKEIDTLLENPNEIRNRMDENLSELKATNPAVYEETVKTVKNAIEFIKTKQLSKHEVNLLDPNRAFKNSDYEKRKFSRYVKYVFEPQIAVHEIMSGVVTDEAAEVLKTLYPITLQKLQHNIFIKLTESGKKLSWADKAKFSKLFDLTGTNILDIQQIYQKPQQPPVKQGKPRKPTSKQVKTIKEEEQTESQRISQPKH